MSGSSATGTGHPLDPPLDEPPVDRASGLFSTVWGQYFQDVADRLQLVADPLNSGGVVGPTSGVILQTGTSTSDPAGLISVTLPAPYTIRTLDFQCDGSPAEPHAYFNQGTVTALPLDVITGVLSKDAGGGSIVAVANAPFTWFATGV